MGRGLRPDVGTVPFSSATKAGIALTKVIPTRSPKTLVHALTAMMQDMKTWEGTASELSSILPGTTDDVPVDATMMSKALAKLASTLATNGIAVEAMKRGKNRGIRLDAKGQD